MPIIPAKPADGMDIKRPLAASGLPTADLTPELLEHFLVLRDGPDLIAVVGVEPAGDAALLRSLAVAGSRRGGGVARQMAAAAESLARSRGFGSLHLLTTTASGYFLKIGYQDAARESAPAGIRGTPQFSGLCPSSSSFMVKILEVRA